MSKEIPETMRAAVLRDPEIGLQVETIRTPHPNDGEVLIKVTACGMCHSDLHVIGGKIAFPLPAVLGHEVTGEIVEIGPNTEHFNFAVGQHVSGAFLMPCGQCEFCAAGRDDLCAPFFDLNRLKGQLYDGHTRLFGVDGEPIAMYSMGALAEYCVIPATSIAVLEHGMDLTASAILGCAALTGYGAVRRGANLHYGETVAVVATGGIGSNIIQVAKAFGAAQIIAIDVADEKLQAAKELGATHTINSTQEDVRTAVFEITHGRGVDVAFEALGRPETWTSALDALRDGGRMVPIGLGAGVQTAAVEINRTVRRSQSILGSYGARTRQDLPVVVKMAAAGKIDYQHIVTQKFALEDAGKGYSLLAQGKIQGRAVVEMSL
ncbi:zinc-binding dehydrogenase [Arcanobacterium hippocoleae]|uniref:S-(Hydroxymethyl)glutathione dehydrogenase/alcohol dehydrogenase n=1 Tax=Arcanobacterium hippocoleae TaxID=149017 RepID=A0ABU1T315_9ACTO|nr:zinc-binding dehydrogenase [Arcanobacterium hippocoleae]MDR6939775.1 S-(hydroxymethyl)glutathione dehydrogenase/alcohol dehydrogenase [Arcanobacterium hippocoleae]